jgi:hypothetical protein
MLAGPPHSALAGRRALRKAWSCNYGAPSSVPKNLCVKEKFLAESGARRRSRREISTSGGRRRRTSGKTDVGESYRFRSPGHGDGLLKLGSSTCEETDVC